MGNNSAFDLDCTNRYTKPYNCVVYIACSTCHIILGGPEGPHSLYRWASALLYIYIECLILEDERMYTKDI